MPAALYEANPMFLRCDGNRDGFSKSPDENVGSIYSNIEFELYLYTVFE
jgi:hypothetical protein